MEQNNPTAEQVEKHLSALGDSVSVIDKTVADNERSESLDKRLKANYDHIEIMLEKDFIKNAGQDLSIFTSAVNKAKAFLV
jgi:hypothetical protein